MNANLIKNFIFAWKAISILLPIGFFCFLISLIFSLLFKKYNNNKVCVSLIIFIAFSVFGTTIGVFMGASASPIVSSLLPPIITLVSGYFVFLGSKEMSDTMKSLLPGSILLLLICLLFSAFYMKILLLPE